MGAPKGELRIAGEPILAYLLRRIAWDGRTMLVTAPGRERPAGHEGFDREVVDPVAGLGPLRGVLTALEHATTMTVAVTTVDMPAIGGEHLRWLVGQLDEGHEALGVMIRRGDQVEPFPSVFRVSAKEIIARELREDRRAVHALCRHPQFVVSGAPREWDQRVWTNLNRPEDVDAFVRGER